MASSSSSRSNSKDPRDPRSTVGSNAPPAAENKDMVDEDRGPINIHWGREEPNRTGTLNLLGMPSRDPSRMGSQSSQAAYQQLQQGGPAYEDNIFVTSIFLPN